MNSSQAEKGSLLSLVYISRCYPIQTRKEACPLEKNHLSCPKLSLSKREICAVPKATVRFQHTHVTLDRTIILEEG